MWFKKSQKLFCQQQNLDQEKSKNFLKLVFRDYSCFFLRKISRNVLFCYLLFYRNIYAIGWAKQVCHLLDHWEVVRQYIFGLFLVQVWLLAKKLLTFLEPHFVEFWSFLVYIYQMIFIGENRWNVLEVTKIISNEKCNLYLNFNYI